MQAQFAFQQLLPAVAAPVPAAIAVASVPDDAATHVAARDCATSCAHAYDARQAPRQVTCSHSPSRDTAADPHRSDAFSTNVWSSVASWVAPVHTHCK